MDKKTDNSSSRSRTPIDNQPAGGSWGVFGTLLPELQKALKKNGYSQPTPIQERAIPAVLKGLDLLGSAQTGTGKTAAFILPILQRLVVKKKPALKGKPRVVILAPTRELAAQIGESIATYGRYNHITKTVIFGGVKQASQVASLNRGKHIVVATPGRLLDLLQQTHLNLSAVETFVLDEADRMLDMGFLPDIRKVISMLPVKRQTLFFSATMGPEVSTLSKTLLCNPFKVDISPDKPAVEEICQKVFFVEQRTKINLLIDMLSDTTLRKVIVFTKMKHQADRISEKLNRAGIESTAIHGDKSQNARTRSLNNFKKKNIRVLVATDIAARGIDIDQISHVVNYDLPTEAETYVHRIGRTARAGAEGDAVSFCSPRERSALREIEKLLGMEIPMERDHEYHSDAARFATGDAARPVPRKPPVTTGRNKSKERLSAVITYGDKKGTSGRTQPRRRKLRHKR